MIKDKGGLTAGWCRSFGLAAHTIGALALAIAHNLKQTLRDRKNPNRKTRRSGQAQESPADPQKHPRRQPRRTGAARLGTRPAPAAPTVTPTVGFSAPGQPKPAPRNATKTSQPTQNLPDSTPTGNKTPPKTGKNWRKST